MKSALTELRIPSLPVPSEGDQDIYADPELPALELRVNRFSHAFVVRVPIKRPTRRPQFREYCVGTWPSIGVTEARSRAAQLLNANQKPRRSNVRRTEAMEPGDRLLTTRQAAELTGMSMAWYERCRWAGSGPPYRRRGRTIRYLRSELIAWWLESSEANRGD